MGKKRISFSLDPDSIGKAIAELEAYKEEFLKKVERFRERVGVELSDRAAALFGGSIVDDVIKGERRTAQVTMEVADRDGISVVIAHGEDAVWVEFGAGVYHNGAAGGSPHPRGSELGMTIGSYGPNGKKNTWGYYDENHELVLTHGTPATMPMYNAALAVCAEIDTIASEVFG